MTWLKHNAHYLAWTTALLAMLGSLYFQYVLHLPPCVLCWYQRIAMYPLVFIIGAGIILKEKKLFYYVFPLNVIGLVIAIYHNLLYYKILPESVAPCVQGISCTSKLIEIFGFITIPLLSLIAFTIIIILIIIHKKQYEQGS